MFGRGGFGHHGFGPWGKFGGGGAACGGSSGGAGMAGQCGPAAFLKGLDLTDEQLLQIAELKGNTFGKMARGKLELMELRKEIFHELLQPQVDKQKVSGVAQKVKEQISGCIDHMVENMIALSQTLNPDQKKRLHLNIIRKLLGLDDITDQDE